MLYIRNKISSKEKIFLKIMTLKSKECTWILIMEFSALRLDAYQNN